jgi:hypothetical protein
VPTPPWAETDDVVGWPTVEVSDEALGYRVPVPALWAHEPVVEHLPTETVHTYRGRTPLDWLSIRRLTGADPAADLADWVDAILQLTGFPVLPPADTLTSVPRLLVWSGVQACPELAARLGAEDLRVADGLGVCQLESGESLLRVYVLLARVAARAWNVNLSLFSACPPNAPEALVRANDHRRGAATFGRLRLG